MSGGDLALSGIGKVFDEHAALRDVNLEVPAGGSLVLLGSSGAGKTTLLRIIAGLDTADEGTVTLGGRVLSDPAVRVAPEHRRVGMVFQALELWPHMTVAEHLAFGLEGRPRGKKALTNETVRLLAEQVGIAPNLLPRRPDTLSGGEQQRVAIARTLAADPQVILYDEPLANLDPDRRRALRALIRRIARERSTTLVYVTHDPEEALELGDEIAVMADGRVVERGRPQTLYRSPTTLAGARALGPVTALKARVEGGRLHTALGALESSGADPLDAGATCLALLRPDDVGPGEGGVEAVIEDVIPRARDWSFRADLAGEAVLGCSDEPLEAGARVALTAQGAASAVPAERSEA